METVWSIKLFCDWWQCFKAWVQVSMSSDDMQSESTYQIAQNLVIINDETIEMLELQKIKNRYTIWKILFSSTFTYCIRLMMLFELLQFCMPPNSHNKKLSLTCNLEEWEITHLRRLLHLGLAKKFFETNWMHNYIRILLWTKDFSYANKHMFWF